MAERNIVMLAETVGVTGQKCKNVAESTVAKLGGVDEITWVAPVFTEGSDPAQKIRTLAADFADGIQLLMEEIGIAQVIEAGIKDTEGNNIFPELGEGYFDNVCVKLAEKAEQLVASGNLYSDTVKDMRIASHEEVTSDNWAKPSKTPAKAGKSKATAAIVELNL